MDCRARVVLELGLNAYRVEDDVIVCEMGHELFVEEGVENFGDDWLEGDGGGS